MNKILTKIQSRLNRRGVKVSLNDIREKYLIAVLDHDNPTEDELSDIVDHFLRIATLPTPIIEALSDESGIDYNESIAITPANKSELVSSTAQSLGIVLNTQEIANIAENINHSSDDLHDSLDEIKSAIIAFIQHKAALNSQKISQVVDDITQIAVEELNQNSQELVNGLQSINQQLQQQSADFKSKVKSTLTAFAIPSIKAG